MSNNYEDFYKYKNKFIKKKNGNISSIDEKLREMLENIRQERRNELLIDFRNVSKKYSFDSIKSNKEKIKYSKFYNEWKLSNIWSEELIEYSWLNFTLENDIFKENFEDWLILPLICGIRCMLIHNNSYCELRDQNGWKIFVVKRLPFKHLGLTIIDGIYNEESNLYCCNDIIVWNNLNMCNSSTECRLHFLKSRIEEFSNNEIFDENKKSINLEKTNSIKIIENLKIKLSEYYSVSKYNLIDLYYNNLCENKPIKFTHLVFVNKNSHYIKYENDTQKYPQYLWYIWRDIEMKKRTENTNKELVFKLKLNTNNELHTSEDVIIGKIDRKKNLNDCFSLENAQKMLLKEHGFIFVNVKFKTINIVNLINSILLNNYRGLYTDHDKSHNENIFELSNISLQNKWSWGSNSIGYTIFHCIEFIIENNVTQVNLSETQSYLNLDLLINSIIRI